MNAHTFSSPHHPLSFPDPFPWLTFRLYFRSPADPVRLSLSLTPQRRLVFLSLMQYRGTKEAMFPSSYLFAFLIASRATRVTQSLSN